MKHLNKILITKDVLKADYLPCYGNKIWKTPNIDELVEKGTIFKRHYTAAPSTAMAVTSMFSGLYPHQIKRKEYVEVSQFNQTKTLFDELEELGYSTNVIWPFEWVEKAWKYSKVFSDNTNIFNLKKFAQDITPHQAQGNDIKPNPEKTNAIINELLKTIDNCFNSNDPIFIWIHLPHVINGRTGYGSDIDLLDKIVGEIRKRFSDNGIYLSADHGHMNCKKGIPVYGFHLYEDAIQIPLITPKIQNKNEISHPTSNTQLKDIILNDKIEEQEYIFSDSQYYLQENRRFAVIKDNYKYIYNKKKQTEELYDLFHDPEENINLLLNNFFDKNRENYYYLHQIHYYPHWDRAKKIFSELQDQKNRIWKQGTFLQELIIKINNLRKTGFLMIKNYMKRNKSATGRWASKTQQEICTK